MKLDELFEAVDELGEAKTNMPWGVDALKHANDLIRRLKLAVEALNEIDTMHQWEMADELPRIVTQKVLGEIDEPPK